VARIAIVGAGISGMATAYLLHRAGHAVTVYERAPRIGGHTRTLTVNYNGTPIAVDTGFIVYNEINYPHLTRLFRHLDVPTQPSNMSLAISLDDGRFEWSARSLNGVFGQRKNLVSPRFWKLIREVARFNREALGAVESSSEPTLGSLLDRLKLSQAFRDAYLLPMGGAIWSCPPEAMLDFPASSFVQFFKNHGLLSFNEQHRWYTVAGGAQEYVVRLTAPYRDHIRTDCGVESVCRSDGQVQVIDTHGAMQRYDRIVFACHADEALAILADPTEDERRILEAFHYQRNIAILHCDASLMPRHRRCWASWVYQTGSTGVRDGVGVTYWMNLLQSVPERFPLFVTLNPVRAIAPEKIFDSHVFTHPVFTRETLAAQQALPSIQGKAGTWFCGAYTRYGFHEDGLLSAVHIAEAMGAPVPWL
jgi:predicted NAD/FAD-binding protein